MIVLLLFAIVSFAYDKLEIDLDYTHFQYVAMVNLSAYNPSLRAIVNFDSV
jgi:hypothetical protein